jgi:hypothetical protein
MDCTFTRHERESIALTREIATNARLEDKHSMAVSQAAGTDSALTRHQRESIALTRETTTNVRLYCLHTPGSLHSPSKGTVRASHEQCGKATTHDHAPLGRLHNLCSALLDADGRRRVHANAMIRPRLWRP